MASSFPGAIDNFTDPLAASPLNSPSHAVQHQDLNDAVEKIETYMGLVKVIPTSVSSAGGTAATLSANGTITVGTGNTSVTINGAFSALYDNYKILYHGGTSSTSTFLSLQLGSSTTSYYGSLMHGNWSANTVAGIGVNNGTSFTYAGGVATNGLGLHVDLMGPFLAKYTYITGHNVIYGNVYGQFAGDHEVNTSYTSFTIIPGAGTITGGTIRVYGYRN